MKNSLILALSLIIGGCAKPVLDIAEPSEWQRTQAQSILNTTHLDSPPAPSSSSSTLVSRVDSVLYDIRKATYSVCREMQIEMEECTKTMNTQVTVYTEDKVINAFADGKEVGVAGGLINAMTDTEIAATLGHEFAHIMFKHPAKKTSNSLVGMSIATGLAVLFSRKTGADISGYGGEWIDAGAIAGGLAYSPAMEIEADRVAVYILKEAGYSPQAMRDAIVRLHREAPRGKKISGASTVAYLRTHPSNDRRIAHIMASIRDAEAGVPLRRAHELKPDKYREAERKNIKKLGYAEEDGLWIKDGPRDHLDLPEKSDPASGKCVEKQNIVIC